MDDQDSHKPDYAETYDYRGIAFGRKALYDEAIADFTKPIELKPDYAGAEAAGIRLTSLPGAALVQATTVR